MAMDGPDLRALAISDRWPSGQSRKPAQKALGDGRGSALGQLSPGSARSVGVGEGRRQNYGIVTGEDRQLGLHEQPVSASTALESTESAHSQQAARTRFLLTHLVFESAHLVFESAHNKLNACNLDVQQLSFL